MSIDQTGSPRPPAMPEVNRIGAGDIAVALKQGLRDFMAAPQYGLFFGAIYAAGGILMYLLASHFNMPWMIIPLAIGFPLIGPFIAAGLYEVSRRQADGRPLSWREVLLTMFRQRERQLAWMAFLVLFVFWVWIYQVRVLFALFLGFESITSWDRFYDVVLLSGQGQMFLAVGTVMGAILALTLFSSTVISIPLLLERELDFVTAIITSVKCVFASPVVMLGWGLIVTSLAILAMAPAFLGLLIVLPILGHATWHLYKRAVKPLTTPA